MGNDAELAKSDGITYCLDKVVPYKKVAPFDQQDMYCPSKLLP